MADYHGTGFPSVSVAGSSESVFTKSDLEYVHLDDLDDIDEVDRLKKLSVYVYSDEDRYDELSGTVTEYRQHYVFATGIVWPSWMRDEMPVEADVLHKVEWALALGGQLTPELLESIRDDQQTQDTEEDTDTDG